jgi:hypothetical protein
MKSSGIIDIYGKAQGENLALTGSYRQQVKLGSTF